MEFHSKASSFLIRETNPPNGEPPLEALVESQQTPTEIFFARNHSAIPEIDPTAYRLHLNGLVARPMIFTLAELQANFPMQSLNATLQCAGNRRREIAALAPIPDELPWDCGAISTAEWRGVSLQTLLDQAGIQPEARHVEFTGLDEVTRLGTTFGFGGSIPLQKALSPEVLLAFEMNGRPLSPWHGFPVRIVTPGYIGARSVKWLTSIEVRAEPSQNYFYARAYQLFPPQARAETVDWSSGIKLGDMPVSAVICTPEDRAHLATERVYLRGYAFAGGGRIIERVDISTNGGAHWSHAEFISPPERWTWRLWQMEIPLTMGENEIAVRAWDEAGNTQPSDPQQTWNFKGYLNNAWHRIRLYRS